MAKHTSNTAEAWPSEWLAALSDKALIAVSSTAIFARGKTYAQADAIEIESEDPLPEPVLRAQISGSDLYDTQVWIEEDAIAGDCNCLSADEGWFCKHQVALALVWRERLAGKASAGSAVHKQVPTRAKRAQTLIEKRQSLRDFLLVQDAEALADKLLALANRDHDLERELQQWQKLSTVRGDPAELKALISEILDTGRDYIEYRESAAYARRAETVLSLLNKACWRDPDSAVGLTIHALECAWESLEQADDSDGEISGLCSALGDIFVEALERAAPQPERFGKIYLQLLLDDPCSSFDDAEAEAAMGPAALAGFRQTLMTQWRQAKEAQKIRLAQQQDPRRPSYVRDSADMVLSSLEHLHLARLEAAGELDVVLAVLSEDLSTDSAYSGLLRFFERHGRQREALAAAERGYKAFPDSWMLETRLLECYQREGMHQEAFALLQKRFAQRPDVGGYLDVIAAGQLAGEDGEHLRQRLMDDLMACEQAALKDPRSLRYTNASGQKGPYVNLRAQILVAEKRWLEACALVQPPALCEPGVLRDIALSLPETHKAEAVALLMRVFNHHMRTASSPYREPLALVGEIIGRMELEARRAWLANLRALYKPKRNFIRDLPAR